MDLGLIAVGNIKEEYLKNKVAEYMADISCTVKITITEVKDEPMPKNVGGALTRIIREKEGGRILACIKPSDYVIALCIDGNKQDGAGLSSIIKKAKEREYDRVLFVIGGSLGLSESVVSRADYRLSFSDMTFPHQLMRVMLLDGLRFTCGR